VIYVKRNAIVIPKVHDSRKLLRYWAVCVVLPLLVAILAEAKFSSEKRHLLFPSHRTLVPVSKTLDLCVRQKELYLRPKVSLKVLRGM